MDNPLTRPSASSLQRPQVFIKVEFGVSWSAQHAPRNHGYEYRSRALRERASHFPRRVPAPTTNYLAATSIQQFQQAQVPQFFNQERPPRHEQNSRQGDSQPEPQQHRQHRSRQVGFAPEPEVSYRERRPSRQHERSSSSERHERGRSAPPPLSDNHWDVVQPQPVAHVSAGSSTACATVTRPVSDVWKELPEVPTRFRLGEEGMPWDSWSIPMGWEPYFEPDPLLQSPSAQDETEPRHFQERSLATEQEPISPTAARLEAPLESPPCRGEDTERVRELEALGSAMMTVDNGFENQWWNQGERQAMATALHPPPTTQNQVREQMALGWAMAHLPPGAEGDSVSFENAEHGHGSLSNVVVSPVSSYSGPSLQPGLSRSLSTRSDELWFTGGRYA